MTHQQNKPKLYRWKKNRTM